MTDKNHSPAVGDVSRETLEKLRRLEILIRKWTPAINLVAKSTINNLWDRHIEDSLQLVHLAPRRTMTWADLGSGGGFPGLVIAIAGPERIPALRVTLIESDQRKAAFLRTAVRELDLPAEVIANRIEDIAPLGSDVVSARALARLDVLLSLAGRHLAPHGLALFLKGASAQSEIEEALEHWRFNHQKILSKTDAAGVILKIEGIALVRSNQA